MKQIKRIMIVVLALVLAVSLSLTAFAATASQDGLELSVTTDKTSYSATEQVTVTVTVKNTNAFAVSNVAVESNVPDGYKAADGYSSTKNIATLGAGETATLTVVYVPESSGQPSGPSYPTYPPYPWYSGNTSNTNDAEETEEVVEIDQPTEGNTNVFEEVTVTAKRNVGLWVLIAVVSAGALIGIVAGKKRLKKTMSIMLCVAMVGTLATVLPVEVNAESNPDVGEITCHTTISANGKSVEIGAKLTYSKNTDMEIIITNEDFDEIDSRLVTQDESIVITGIVNSANSVKQVSAKYESYYDESEDANVTGTTSWSTEIPLDIGTNTVTISAVDGYGTVKYRTVYVKRINSIIEYSDNVKMADEEDYQAIADGIVGFWRDDNQTEDDTDDSIVMIVYDNSLLMSQIQNGLLQSEDIYIIPQNEVFTTGFTGQYEYHQAPRGNENYPIENYPDSIYEEIVFSVPGLDDMFNGALSLDFSEGIDQNNPVAFATSFDGTPLDVIVDNQAQNIFSYNSIANSFDILNSNYRVSSISDDDKYPRKGWQPQELVNNLIPSLKVSKDTYGRMNVTVNWKDVVIFDHDGVKNSLGTEDVDYGQVKLSGELGIKNISYKGGVEWNPSFWDYVTLDVLPDQIISKLTYEKVGSLELKTDATISTEELIKALNGGFDNKTNISKNLSFTGVNSLKNKWVLFNVGFNIATFKPINVSGKSIKGLAEESKTQAFCPILVFAVFMDFDGKLTAEGAISFEYTSKVENGFNIQKNGFTGAYGSQNQNRSDKHYNIGSNYTLDIYDKEEVEKSLSLSGKAEASLDWGVGIGGGLMISGVIPAMITGEFFYRVKGLCEIEGSVNFLPTFSIDGNLYASVYQGIGAKAELDANILLKYKKKTLLSLPFEEKWEHMFWEDTLTTGCLDGTVYVADFDGDNSNNEKLPGAKITLTKNDTHKNWEAYTDENGYYQIKSIPDGEYTIVVEKDGYDTYVNANLIYSQKLTHDVYINKHSEWNGICSLSGKITIADEDTDMTNNLPLEGALVKIVSEENGSSKSTLTNADGTYSIDKIPAGNYQIYITKEGYVPAFEFITVADNIPNYFNATIEAISEDFDGEGYASGAIIDAFDGHYVPGLTLEIYKGINNVVGPLERICETVSDEYGEYITPALSAGSYTVRIKDNRVLDDETLRYYDSSFTIKVLGNRTIPNQNGTVTNGLGVGQIRAVLHWGQYPEDLDSHLVGPTEDGYSFHIYYEDMNYSDDSTTVGLDLDDITSYGPETTTIYESSPGIFTYLVHDYTNRYAAFSSELANSGAYVEIYIGTSSVAAYTFNVPNIDGTVWTVFQYDSTTGEIKSINTMDYESSPYAVGSNYANSTIALFDLSIGQPKPYELAE